MAYVCSPMNNEMPGTFCRTRGVAARRLRPPVCSGTDHHHQMILSSFRWRYWAAQSPETTRTTGFLDCCSSQTDISTDQNLLLDPPYHRAEKHQIQQRDDGTDNKRNISLRNLWWPLETGRHRGSENSQSWRRRRNKARCSLLKEPNFLAMSHEQGAQAAVSSTCH